MNPVWIVGNGTIVIGCLVCMAFIIHLRRSVRGAGWPFLSIALIAVTASITALQFIYPEVLSSLRRDGDALRAGEFWRLVTPLFVQPKGVGQCLFNAFFLVAFLPIAERLYGWGLLALYFVAGVAGQLVNYAWDPSGGGASTAAFGVMGSLVVYVLRHRRRMPPWLTVVALAALCGAATLSLFHDGHGPAFLVGALVALFLPAQPPPEADR